MTDDIPRLLPPDQMPPIRSVADLDRFWRSIKGPWGFSQVQLWCVVLSSAGEVTPLLMNIDDCPDTPDVELIDNLFGVLAEVMDTSFPGGSVAVMFARPGGGGTRADDRAWARQLSDAGQRAPVDVWPVFLADDERVRIAAPDDLAA